VVLVVSDRAVLVHHVEILLHSPHVLLLVDYGLAVSYVRMIIVISSVIVLMVFFAVQKLLLIIQN